VSNKTRLIILQKIFFRGQLESDGELQKAKADSLDMSELLNVKYLHKTFFN